MTQEAETLVAGLQKRGEGEAVSVRGKKAEENNKKSEELSASISKVCRSFLVTHYHSPKS